MALTREDVVEKLDTLVGKTKSEIAEEITTWLLEKTDKPDKVINDLLSYKVYFDAVDD